MGHNPDQICFDCGVAPTRNARTMRCTSCNATETIARYLRKRVLIQRKCLDCGEPTLGTMLRCLPHNTIHIREKARTAQIRHRAKYRAANLAATVIGQLDPAHYYNRGRRLHVTLLRAREQSAQVEEINALVPGNLPGREDIVQDILLSLYDGTGTIEAIRAGGWRKHLRPHYLKNFEDDGRGVSIDVAQWHDRIAAP